MVKRTANFINDTELPVTAHDIINNNLRRIASDTLKIHLPVQRARDCFIAVTTKRLLAPNETPTTL